MANIFPRSGLDWINIIITTTLSLLGLGLIMFWFQITPQEPLDLRLAVSGNSIPKSLSTQTTNLKGTFIQFNGMPSSLPGQWLQFRGAQRDNVVRQVPALRSSLNTKQLPIRWSQDLGEGYAGAAIANSCVYLLDYDKEKQSDALRCFSLDTGEEIWQRHYRVPIKRNHGISRTVPAVNNRYVVTIGPKCHVLCADAKTGEFIWGIDLVSQYNTEVPLWYTGQCPLIDNDTVVLAPGGSALLIGVDLATGKILWETPNPEQWKMSHSSIVPMTFLNQRFYVYCSLGAMVGVVADGPDRGRIAWQTEAWSHSVISPSPVQLPNNRLLVTAGYGVGSKIFKLKQTSSGFNLEEIMQLDKEVFACEQHTPIYYQDLLYTVLPNDAGQYNRQLVCMTLDGKIQWRSGRDHVFGLGPFIIADNKIFVLDDNGLLTIARTGGKQYRQLGQAQVLQGRETWAPIALANGLMVLRDFKRMICLDMRE